MTYAINHIVKWFHYLVMIGRKIIHALRTRVFIVTPNQSHSC